MESAQAAQVAATGAPPFTWPKLLGDWREIVFTLSWHQHQGSGLACDVATALEMEIGDALWFVERINERRKDEAEALRKASKG